MLFKLNDADAENSEMGDPIKSTLTNNFGFGR